MSPVWEIVHSDCLEAMAELPDGCVDVVITDPPYDDHTHRAQRTGITGYVEPTRPGATRAQYYRSRDLAFEPMTPGLMEACASAWARLALRWVLVFCSLEMISDWRAALERAGLQYVRTQIWHRRGGAPQFTGDRPAQACEAIITAHRPGRKRWNAGGKHGFYEDAVVLNRGKKKERLHTAQKPLGLMRELVRRFTNPGELVLDPFAGSGSTGHACLLEGRAFLGIEMQEKYVEVARRRLEEVHGTLPARDIHEQAV